MRPVVAFAVGALTLTMCSPAAAQEFKPPANLFAQKKPAPNPPKVDWNWRPAADQNAAALPAIVCGMTVIPADPKIDPKIARKSQDAGVKYTLRVVEPTVCKAP